MFRSRAHALNAAANLRRTADRERADAARAVREGDVFGAGTAASNARVAEARARLADEAAELLRGDGDS